MGHPTKSFDILNTVARGPSREELFDALRLFDEQRFVVIQYTDAVSGEQKTADIRVERIGVEDGSAQKWIVGGRVEHREVKLYLNTRDRSGWISFPKAIAA